MGAVKPKFTPSSLFLNSILAWSGGEDKAFNTRGQKRGRRERGPLATRRGNFVGLLLVLLGTNF